MNFKMLSAKWCSFSLCLNVTTYVFCFENTKSLKTEKVIHLARFWSCLLYTINFCLFLLRKKHFALMSRMCQGISSHDTLFKLMTKKTSKFWIAGALWGASIDEWFPSQRASITFCQDLPLPSIPDWLRCQADWGWWHFSINWITLMLPTNVGITGTLLMFLSTSCLNQ